MLQNYNKYKVLKVFLDSPTEFFGLREICRLVGISPKSVLNYLDEFQKEELIERIEKKGKPFYQARRENENFILCKKISIIFELEASGVVGKLWDFLSPDAVILYGSHIKGEAIEGSDIDLFVLGKKKNIDLSEYEDKLGKEIHLIIEEDVSNIPKELKNNLINGIVLRGYFKVFK